MAEAVLTLRADARSLLEALSRAKAAGATTANALSSEFARAAREAGRSWELANQRVAQSYARAAAARRAVARAGDDAERRSTRVALTETNYRTSANQSEAEKAKRSADEVAAARERAERRATAASIREASRRAALDRQRAHEAAAQGRASERQAAAGGASARGGAQAAWRTVQGVSAAYQATIGQTGGALEQYADIEHVLNAAVRQTTSDPAEMAERRRELVQFAVSHDLSPAAVADAASSAQEHFSALGDRTMTRAQRDARSREFQANLLEAADTGQDLGAYSQLAGALASQGLGGDTQRAIMRSLTGIGQRGSVDMSNLLQGGGLRGIMSAVARAAPQGEAAVQAAITEQVSALEVLAPHGISVTQGANSLNNMTSALGGDRTQQALLAHVRNRFGAHSALEAQLFETDARGHASLRGSMRNALALGETLAAATGNDPDALRNLLGTETNRANGHVLHQVLTQPQRDALAALAGRDMSGKTGYEQLHDISAGAAITQADVDVGAGLRRSEIATRLQRTRNTEMVSLLDDPRMQRQAEDQRRFAAAHPLINNLLDQLPGQGTGDMIRQVIGETGATAHDRGALEGIRLAPNTTVELGPTTVAAITRGDPHTQAQAAAQAAAGPNGAPRRE